MTHIIGCCKAVIGKRQTNTHDHVADLGASPTQGMLSDCGMSAERGVQPYSVTTSVLNTSTAHGIAGVQAAGGRDMLSQ